MIFQKKTKWQVLASYNDGGTDYVVLARKGIGNGMLYFKTKRITPRFTCSYNLSTKIFDIKVEFEKLINQQPPQS